MTVNVSTSPNKPCGKPAAEQTAPRRCADGRAICCGIADGQDRAMAAASDELGRTQGPRQTSAAAARLPGSEDQRRACSVLAPRLQLRQRLRCDRSYRVSARQLRAWVARLAWPRG